MQLHLRRTVVSPHSQSQPKLTRPFADEHCVEVVLVHDETAALLMQLHASLVDGSQPLGRSEQ